MTDTLLPPPPPQRSDPTANPIADPTATTPLDPIVFDRRTPRSSGSRRSHVLTGGIAAAVAAIAASGITVAVLHDDGPVARDAGTIPHTSSSPIAPVSTNTAGGGAGAPIDTAAVVAAATPSVVSIHVEVAATDIFQQQVTQEGAGTGFVASADGVIYTNAHVVADAENVQVTLADGSTHDGKVLGVDTTDDLAVVKVDASGLTPLPVGSSAAMHVGDPVVAVGNSLALPGGPTATLGIVSAIGRTIDTNNGEHLARLIQTDAAINPGNSGGPLLDAAGEVVAINTATATDAQNIGFAIAIDSARPILEELAQGKPHVKAFLGIQTEDVTADTADAMGVSIDHGAYVTGVTAESGADVGGIQVGDVVTGIDDDTVDVATDIADALAAHRPGDHVVVHVHRGADDLDLDVVLGSHKA